MYVDKVWSGQLLDGLPGTNQTLDWMAALVRRDAASPKLRSFALNLISSCGGHEFDCEIEQVFNYVRDSITYRRDPVNVESIQDVWRTLFTFQAGDCDDRCVALASLLGSLGHRSRFVVLGQTREKFTHVFIETLTKKGWIPLDCTPEQSTVGWQAKGVIRQVYEIWPEGKGNIGTLIAIAILTWWFLK